jgi:hypothetical protein
MFERFLSGWGYKEIANHLNRPGGPPPPTHVDSTHNTAGKWSKNTLRSILQNHAEAALAGLAAEERQDGIADVDAACEILDGLPDLARERLL